MFKLFRYFELYVINIDACEKLNIIQNSEYEYNQLISLETIHIEQTTCKGIYFDSTLLYYSLFFRFVFGFVFLFNKLLVSKNGFFLRFDLLNVWKCDISLHVIYYLINNNVNSYRFFDRNMNNTNTISYFSLRNNTFNFNKEQLFLLNYVDPEYQNFFRVSFCFSSYFNKSLFSDRIILSLIGVNYY